jgi:hypothetical protein
MSRVSDTCPYRQPLPVPSGKATHACLLALGISGAENPSLCAVNEYECGRCCDSAPPTAEEPNGIVASTLYKALQQIKNAGGVPGCDAATAAMMLPLAMRYLDVSSADSAHSTGGPRPHPCRHLGAQTGEQPCRTCRGNVRRKVFDCHHPRHHSTTLQQCLRCRDYKPRPPSQKVARWAIGMTTAPRASNTLNRTLRSLRNAGWTERVHLFAEPGARVWATRIMGGPLAVIRRKGPPLGAWPNFFLGLQELYLRQPDADAYLMVQDDVIFCRGLRDYLEDRLWPKGARVGVVSLHTPSHFAAEKSKGFFPADLGWTAWGAQALIFPNASARAFLSDSKVVEHRQKGILDGTKNVDSVVGDWCARTKHHFWMHSPSLTEHIGVSSTLWPGLGLDGRRSSADFPGENIPANSLPVQNTMLPPMVTNEPATPTVSPAPKPAPSAPATPLVIPPPKHVPLGADPAHPVAVLCVHFNFAGFVEPRRNLMRFLLQCRSFGIAVYGMEICLHGTQPVTMGFPGWWVENISQNGILWQKEAAINELARRVPRHCQILAWVDTDIWFENPRWPEDLVRMMENGTRVVQLFDRANWMDREGRIELTRESAVKARNHDLAHPGFAWAAMRDFWLLSPGLYDLALAGSGDTITAAILLGVPLSHSIRTAIGHEQIASRRHYEAWHNATIRWCRGRVGFLPGDVWHEWHGERSERRYNSRRAMMRDFEPSHVVRTSSGLIEWSESAPSELRDGLVHYFLARKEDG